MTKTTFNIYIASLSSSSKSTCEMFENACLEILGKNNYQLNVIDIIKNPKSAEVDRIIAIPTIIRKDPSPARRAIGEILDNENALRAVKYLTNDL